MLNYAYYNVNTGLIENVICCKDDLASTLVWPEGYAIVNIADNLSGEWSMCGIGWSYINNKFIEPPKPPEPIESVVVGAQTL